jgi:hypothetical protein
LTNYAGGKHYFPPAFCISACLGIQPDLLPASVEYAKRFLGEIARSASWERGRSARNERLWARKCRSSEAALSYLRHLEWRRIVNISRLSALIAGRDACAPRYAQLAPLRVSHAGRSTRSLTLPVLIRLSALNSGRDERRS